MNEEYRKLIAALGPITKTMSEINKQVNFSVVTDALLLMSKEISKQLEPIYKNQEYYADVLSQLREIIQNISIPGIDKDKTIEGFKRWGSFGWSPLSRGFSYKFYMNCPSTLEDTDSLCGEYFNEGKTEDLFDLILKKQINENEKFDLLEAIDNFKRQKYKSSVLVLFSLIDGFYIKSEQERYTEKVPVGLKAGKEVLQRIRDLTDPTEKFINVCFLENLIKCHAVLFAYGNDFKTQPEIINRNFVEHGMLSSKVRKLDCLKVFLYYYNILTIIGNNDIKVSFDELQNSQLSDVNKQQLNDLSSLSDDTIRKEAESDPDCEPVE